MTGFRTDPDDLRAAANYSLNRINDDHLVPAKDDLALAGHEDADAFKGGPELGEVRAEWQETCRLLTEVLSDNIDNVELAEQALVEIAGRYEAEDAAIAGRLHAIGGMS